MPRLRRSDCSGPGIRRRRRGRGFEYLDDDGNRIVDRSTISRLATLSIPPAWKDVWICRDPLGHLQATGVDDAGRKQYLYHEQWRLRRDQEKFDQMLEFARALPRVRRRVAADIASAGIGAERVLGCAVRMLDRGLFRIGGEDYAEQNETYGLATLRRKHVRIDGDEIHFDYAAKGGQRREQVIADADVAEVIRRLLRRRSADPQLLAYKERGRWQDVRSDEVNAYIKEVAGDDHSAKDFRTWSATVLAALALAFDGPPPETKSARKRRVNEAVKGVAFFLGNTPAVCRRSYIDPRLIDRFDDGLTIGPALRRRREPSEAFDERTQRSIERAVIRLLDA